MTIGSRQRIGVTYDDIAIKLGGSKINKVETVKSLGVHILLLFFFIIIITRIITQDKILQLKRRTTAVINVCPVTKE